MPELGLSLRLEANQNQGGMVPIYNLNLFISNLYAFSSFNARRVRVQKMPPPGTKRPVLSNFRICFCCFLWCSSHVTGRAKRTHSPSPSLSRARRRLFQHHRAPPSAIDSYTDGLHPLDGGTEGGCEISLDLSAFHYTVLK